jgi:outer membrane protein OmpA-like peptidoglycan-associated protein/tetratricopeptide (TPR) repeat protein
MKHFLGLILFFAAFTAGAQTYDPSKVNPKAKKLQEDAISHYRDGDVKKALQLLNKAIETDSYYLDAHLDLATLYNELKDYNNARIQFEKALPKDTGYFKYSWLPYSVSLAGAGNFAAAMTAIDKYLANTKLGQKSIQLATSRRKSYQFALEYAGKHPADNYVFAPKNLGDNINSAQLEYYPSVTIDDSVFVFTRRGSNVREDFFTSSMSDKGYSKAKLMENELNDEPYKGALHISLDGEWLIFAADYGPKGYGGYDLYISFWDGIGWSKPENLGPNINTEAWESSPSLSPDKKALYFSSTRFGGYGKGDIYVSYLFEDGWSKSLNMGPQINTPAGEIAPFIHADNETMYFTSDGLQGYGGTDLYLVKKDITTGAWGAPQNLGYPINTIDDEGGLFVAADGVTAYYSSDRSDSRGGLDIYKFELRPNVRPARTLYVQGFVYDAKTKKGLPSTVELIDNKTNTARTSIQTDEGGNYFITLPVGNDYTFVVNKPGYLYYSKLYELATGRADSIYRNDIPLQPIEMNTTVRLKNIQFELNSFKLKNVSLVELDKLYQLLAENPNLKLLISGHTDNVGAPADNLKLSLNRAKAVVDYLVGKGIDIKRLTWKGFGETKPISDNKTEEGRALNRRTEFTIVGM